MKIVIRLISVLSFISLLGCAETSDKQKFAFTMQRDSTYGVFLIIDQEYGCQYIAYRKGGLQPRLDAEGKHICGHVIEVD